MFSWKLKCFQWVPMISWHRTQNVFPTKCEILWPEIPSYMKIMTAIDIPHQTFHVQAPAVRCWSLLQVGFLVHSLHPEWDRGPVRVCLTMDRELQCQWHFSPTSEIVIQTIMRVSKIKVIIIYGTSGFKSSLMALNCLQPSQIVFD